MDILDLADLPKKYTHTFIQFRDRGHTEWQTIYVHSIHVEGMEFAMIVSGKDDKKISVSSMECEFKWDFPEAGVYNYKNTVVIANKYPARQWKKAATPENFTVHCPIRNLLMYVRDYFIVPRGFLVMDFKFNTTGFDCLFHPTYFSLEKAKILLHQGKNAVAMNKQFFVTNSYYGKGFLIWRYNMVVAEIKGTAISYTNKTFEQELKDFFKRTANA